MATAADFNALMAARNMAVVTGVESPPGQLMVRVSGAQLTIADRDFDTTDGITPDQIPVILPVDQAIEIFTGFPTMPNVNVTTILRPILVQVFRAYNIGRESGR